MPDDAGLHRKLFVYLSDIALEAAVLAAREQLGVRQTFAISSLDHSVWIHPTARVGEWLMWFIDSRRSSEGRGYSRGSVYDDAADGVVVASVAQEAADRRELELKILDFSHLPVNSGNVFDRNASTACLWSRVCEARA